MNENEEIEGQEEEIDSSGTITQTPVTATMSDEQIERITQGIANAVAPRQQAQEEYQAEEIDPDTYFTAAQVLAREQALEQRLTAQFANMAAPAQISTGMATVTSGLDDVGKAFVDKALNGLTPAQKAVALSDPLYSDMVRSAALQKMAEKSGGYVQGSNDVAPRGGQDTSLSSTEKIELEAFMRGTGLPEKKAKELYLASRSKN